MTGCHEQKLNSFRENTDGIHGTFCGSEQSDRKENQRKSKFSWEEVELLQSEGKLFDNRITELEVQLSETQFNENLSRTSWSSGSTANSMDKIKSTKKNIFQFIPLIQRNGASYDFVANGEDISEHSPASCPPFGSYTGDFEEMWKYDEQVSNLKDEIEQANAEIELMESKIEMQKEESLALQRDLDALPEKQVDPYVKQLEIECQEAEDELDKVKDNNQELILTLQKVNRNIEVKKTVLLDTQQKRSEATQELEEIENENNSLRETINERLQDMYKQATAINSLDELNISFIELINLFDSLKEKENILCELVVARTLERKEILISALKKIGLEQKRIQRSLNSLDDLMQKQKIMQETIELSDESDESDDESDDSSNNIQELSILSGNTFLTDSLRIIDKELCSRLAIMNDENTYKIGQNKDHIRSDVKSNEKVKDILKNLGELMTGPSNSHSDRAQNARQRSHKNTESKIKEKHLDSLMQEKDKIINSLKKENSSQAATIESLQRKLVLLENQRSKETKSNVTLMNNLKEDAYNVLQTIRRKDEIINDLNGKLNEQNVEDNLFGGNIDTLDER